MSDTFTAAEPTAVESDADLALRLAAQTGAGLVELRDHLERRRFAPWQVMDGGDAAAQRFIEDQLRRHRPADAVLSEEGLEDPRRFDTDRVWIVDPLDGTREFGEPGRPDWAVHIAVWDHGLLTAGAVSLPAMGLAFGTDPAPILPPTERSAPRLVTSRSRAPHAALIVADALGCDAIRLGSAGAKAMAVVTGEADIYLHDGGMYQWDSAAPVAVALAAGLHASRIDGSPLIYNRRDPWLPDLLICRPELSRPVLDALWG